ncbi:MAG: hypothetical protein QOH04_2610 [Sphingomonadales bacterium]|nr:hypothetical protein [Sphingomonadales bacterium]
MSGVQEPCPACGALPCDQVNSPATAADARKTLLGIEIPRDELALRIAQPCLGMTAPAGADSAKALDDMDRLGGPVLMGQSFRRAADAAVLYFRECINAGSQPS